MTIGSAIIGVGKVHPINERVRSMKEVKQDVKPEIGVRAVLAVDIYSLIGLVAGTLRLAGLYDQEQEFTHRSIPMNTFKEIYELAKEYVMFDTEEDNVGSG